MLRSLGLVLAIGLLAACSGHDCADPGKPRRIGFKGGHALSVRIADDEQERSRGLMGATFLPADDGMAFLFGRPTQETFWMKDTLIPLSVAFISEEKIVTIRDMEPCADDPCPTYASIDPYSYAVEANLGWFSSHGIAEGDRVESFDGPFCS